jgi:hypothetical protein
MKINSKFLQILTFLFFCTYFSSFAQMNDFQDQKDNDRDKLIIKTLKSFYTEYITQCDKSNYDTLMSIRQKYCSKNLINRIYYNKNDSDILDYDPFLQAQDCDKSTIQTLKVWKDIKNPNLYYVSYKWPYSEEKITIRTIIKYEGSFKIDSLPDMHH